MVDPLRQQITQRLNTAVQGLSSDGDVLPAPQLTCDGANDRLGSLEQALLLARASQVIKVGNNVLRAMCRGLMSVPSLRQAEGPADHSEYVGGSGDVPCVNCSACTKTRWATLRHL